MNKYSKVIAFLLVLLVLAPIITPIVTVYADRNEGGTNPGKQPSNPTPPSPPPTGGNDSGGGDTEGGDTGGGDTGGGNHRDDDWNGDIYYYINMKEPNFRTMQVLDVASIMNDNVESIADYRPDTILQYLESLPDFKIADIREYINFEKESRHKRLSVPVVDEKQKDYVSKVQTLIESNILNRDKLYSVSPEGAYIAPKEDIGGKRTIKRYEDPNQPISRTDFLVELMKTEEIIMSSPILVRSKYSRVNNLNRLEFIETEPVETSAYQGQMGKLGLDTGQTDVIIDHNVYGRISVMTTNDIVELYLAKAYNKGLIRKDELNTLGSNASAKELLKYIEDGLPSTYAPNNSLPPRWALTEEPLRKNYTKEYPTGKIWEEDNLSDGQYPEKLSLWEEVKEEMANISHNFNKQTSLWGQAYNYNGLQRGDSYNNWFEPAKFTIERKDSILQDPANGYSFFKSESLTLMDAYMYAHQHMKTTEGEKSLTETEIEYLNSSYSLNMTSMRKDEKEAVNYLLAKGIIDGDDMNLYKSIYLPLTNATAIDILWKINQPNERIKIVPTLTELDQQMLSKGYSQATVEIRNSQSPKPMAFINTDSGVDVNPLDRKDLFEIFLDYKEVDKSTYDLIFVRLPKLKGDDSNQNLRLVVNDPYRTELQSFHLLTGVNKEPALDGFGYEWRGYMVHKDSSLDLMLLGTSDKEIYTIEGISGEGFYWIPNDEPVGKFSKWTVDEFLNNPSVYSFINKTKTESMAYMQMRAMILFEQRTLADNSINSIIRMAGEQKIKNEPNPVSKALELLSVGVKSGLTEDKIKIVNSAMDSVDKSSITNDKGKGKFEVVWKSPTYLSNVPVPKDIIYGPLKEDELKQLKYAGDYVALYENGNFTINSSNKEIPKTKDGKTPKLKITKEGEGDNILYYINLTPNTFSYDIELANFTQKLSIEEGTPGKKLPGYAQMTDREGEPFVIIAKSELENFGIEAISDKILENKTTGQRAFLNTDDNYTLIGNNLTHYLPGDMLVYAYGAGTDHTMETGEADKVFYNLNVVLELINDINVVAQSAGKSISVNINPNEKFQVVQVEDAENRLEGDTRTVIDQTYLLNSTETKDGIKSYINLSALGGPTSNFIYYKDKATTSSVEALIVYKPKATYTNYTRETLNTLRAQMGKSGGSEKEMMEDTKNQLGFGKNLKENTSEKRAEEIKIIKNQIMSKLFIGVEEDTPFLGEDYIYNIYILAKTDTPEGRKTAQDAFMARIVGTDKTVWDKVKEYTQYAPGEQSDVNTGEQDLTISVMPVGVSPIQNTDLLEHTATGNLYMYMANSKDKKVSADQSSQYRKLFYQNMYLDSSKVEGANRYQLMFRQKHYYQNTPDNHIPLERYAEHTGSFGSMFISGGQKMVNFKTYGGTSGELKNHYKYRLPSNDINNNYTIQDKDTNEVGLFSNLEMPYIELDFKSPMKGLNSDNKVIDVDLTKAKTEIELTKMIYQIIAKVFQDEINKTVSPVPNVPQGVADGDIRGVHQYNLSEVMKTSTVGFAENKPETIRSLMQGTWDGILPERINNSQYNIYDKDKTEGIDIPKNVTPMDDNSVVVLAVGKNPHIIDSKNKSIKEGKLTAFKVTRDSNGLLDPIDYNGTNKKEVCSIDGYSDIKTFAEDKKVYIKPSIGIPQGTTVVDRRGGLLMRKHPTPREEVLYSSDLINSLIMRMQLGNNYEGKVFIHELDAGSVIKLGDNRYVVKTSPKQPRDNGSLQWVSVVTLPASEKERGGEIDKKGMNDYSMMSRFLSTWGNTVTIPYNIASASVPLKSIVAKGVYNIPVIDELNQSINAKDKKASKHFTSDIWTKQSEDKGKDNYDIVGTTWAKGLASLVNRTYPHIRFKENKSITKALPVIEINLPPTIAVKQAKSDSLDYHYEIDMYYDIKGFNVDKDNTYIQYLRDRDTNAKDVLEGLEQLRAGTLDGMKYKEYAKNKRITRGWQKVLDVLSNLVPIVCIFLMIIVLVLYVAFRLPGIRNIILHLSERFGLEIGNQMLYGALTEDNLPSISSVSIICITLATVALLFFDNTGIKILVQIWLNIVSVFK